MINTKELRRLLEEDGKNNIDLDEIHELLDRLEAAEKELAELRSSMKFRTSLIGRTEAERDALRVENETLAANLRGKHSTAGATYAHLIAERDALRAALQHETNCVEAAKAKIEALRSKIEAMERQEPAGKFIQHPSNGLWEQDGYGDNPDARPLYALPGAQPEPSVPDDIVREVLRDCCGTFHGSRHRITCEKYKGKKAPEAKP